jgi:hypothetical protein
MLYLGQIILLNVHSRQKKIPKLITEVMEDSNDDLRIIRRKFFMDWFRIHMDSTWSDVCALTVGRRGGYRENEINLLSL